MKLLKYLLVFSFFCSVPAFAEDRCQHNVTDIFCSEARVLQASQFLNHDAQKLLNVVTNTRPFNYAIEDVRQLKVANNRLRRSVYVNDDQHILDNLEAVKLEVENVEWILNHRYDATTNPDVLRHLKRVQHSYNTLESSVLLYVTTH